MNFIKKENLYTPGELLINGERGFRYADIILGDNETYHHAVFFKWRNIFTIMMDDYQTLPTTEITSKVLSVLCNVDISGPANETIDKTKIKTILSKLNPDQNYYKVDNYIIRTEEKDLSGKKARFLLNDTLSISSLTSCIFTLGTMLQISISGKDKEQLDKYDKSFFVSTNGETIFSELLCTNVTPNDDSLVLNLITEQEYFMKHSLMKGIKISGSPLWVFQLMEYTLNKDRDNPIEMWIENQPINSNKRRFFFLFSIQGLKVQNDVRFGLVTFSNDSGISVDREVEYNATLSQSSHCYAQIAVANVSLRLAAEEAANMVNKAVSLLQIILLDDSPRSFFNTKDTYRSWNFTPLNATLLVNEYFYVEDVIDDNQYAILNQNISLITEPLTVNDEVSSLLNNDNILEDFFYLTKSKVVDDLLQSVIWLNTSLKAQETKEKIIALYNCVEFLVTGEKGTLLDEELRSEYGSEYDSAIGEIKKIITEIENKDLKNRLNGVIDSSFTGNSSVQSKLKALVNRLPLNVEPAEWNLFDKLKKNRHRLIHNKRITSPITSQELNELFHLFSKIIVYKIIDISNGGKHD